MLARTGSTASSSIARGPASASRPPGKGYLHVRQALRDLGIHEGYTAALGIRVYKIGLVWPLEEEGARAFADGLETVLVVEERRDVIEHQLRAAAYGLADGRHPRRILGKQEYSGAPLISDVMDIDTAHVARAILRTIPKDWKTNHAATEARLDDKAAQAAIEPLHVRQPYFCSGCPHST